MTVVEINLPNELVTRVLRPSRGQNGPIIAELISRERVCEPSAVAAAATPGSVAGG